MCAPALDSVGACATIMLNQRRSHPVFRGNGDCQMKTVLIPSLSVLLLGSGYVWAQETAPAPPQAVEPSTPQPSEQPPPPPRQLPAPPQQQAQAAPPPAQQPTGTGQCVYTQQYGWVWMPSGTE